MPSKNLSQVVAYISPELKEQLEHSRRRSSRRISMSAYIESVLMDHIKKECKPKEHKARVA